MKHGPIALIDERMPVVTIALRDGVYDKMVSQVEQVKARGGIVIAVATEGDEAIRAQGRSRAVCAGDLAAAHAGADGAAAATAGLSHRRSGAAATWISRATWPSR